MAYNFVLKHFRIVNGVEAGINEFPWIALMIRNVNGEMCGGTLIASEWIITAAHCVTKERYGTQPTDPKEMIWTLGEHDFLVSRETKVG